LRIVDDQGSQNHCFQQTLLTYEGKATRNSPQLL
jgi:hypothetical protein